jgi:hypothetical protein
VKAPFIHLDSRGSTMEQIMLSVTGTPMTVPPTLVRLNDRSGEDVVLRLVLREFARSRSNRQRAERRRSAARRDRQFERRALAAIPRS